MSWWAVVQVRETRVRATTAEPIAAAAVAGVEVVLWVVGRLEEAGPVAAAVSVAPHEAQQAAAEAAAALAERMVTATTQVAEAQVEAQVDQRAAGMGAAPVVLALVSGEARGRVTAALVALEGVEMDSAGAAGAAAARARPALPRPAVAPAMVTTEGWEAVVAGVMDLAAEVAWVWVVKVEVVAWWGGRYSTGNLVGVGRR